MFLCLLRNTFIIVFLTSKMIAVELTTLLPIINHRGSLSRIGMQLFFIFCLGICILSLLLWWQYIPENNKILSMIVTGILFILARMIVLSCILVLVRLVFKRKPQQTSQVELPLTNQLTQVLG